MNYFCKRLLAVGLVLVLAIAPVAKGEVTGEEQSNSKTVNVVFRDNDATLHNPLMGWEVALYPKEILLTGIPSGYDVVYLTATWDALEPEEGVYKWEELDASLAICKRKGVSVLLGLFLQASDVGNFTGIPDWIWTKYNIPYQIINTSSFAPVGRPDYPTKHPLYYNKLYQEKVRNFLRAFAEHYPDGTVDILSVRCYSLYGEWDCGWNPFDWKGDRDLKVKTLHELIQIYVDCFADYRWTRLMIDVPQTEGSVDKYKDYLVEGGWDLALANGWMIRNCGVGANYDMRRFFVGQMIERWFPYTAITAETWFGWDPDNQSVEGTLQTFYSMHCNEITFGMWSGSADWQRQALGDLFDEALRTIGYRLLPFNISYPSTVKAGGTMMIKSKWKNLGVGVCWRKYPLCITFRDSEGRKLWSYIDQDFDQTLWVRNQIYDVETTFVLPDGMSDYAGKYDVYISLLDGRTGTPAIAMPIGETQPENREYKIGSIIIKPKQ